MGKTKNKLLSVLEIMRETDERHPLTSVQIVEKLAERGIECERKSVLRDVAALTDFGYDILQCEDNKRGYYMASRLFEDWELKVLLDAVMGAKFLTEQNGCVLQEKLCKLGSQDFRRTLRAVTPVPTITHFGDPTTKNHIDLLLQAVRKGNKVAFRYTHLGSDCKPHLHRNGHIYRVSPYAMIWRYDKYYLICNCEQDGKKRSPLSFFRLDRIRDMEMLPDSALPVRDLLGDDAEQRLREFVGSAVNNFAGRPVSLRLRCKIAMVDILVDDFGHGLRVEEEEDEWLTVVVPASESQGLYNWLMQYGDCVELLEPIRIRNELKHRIAKAAGLYKL